MSDCARWELLLSQFEKGELGAESSEDLRNHLAKCEACRGALAQLAALSKLCATDEAPALDEDTPPLVLAALEAALAMESRSPDPDHEILTLEEVARFMRVSPEELEDELPSLPVFEFAGRLRVRRSRLLAWIDEREKQGQARRYLSLVSLSS